MRRIADPPFETSTLGVRVNPIFECSLRFAGCSTRRPCRKVGFLNRGTTAFLVSMPSSQTEFPTPRPSPLQGTARTTGGSRDTGRVRPGKSCSWALHGSPKGYRGATEIQHARGVDPPTGPSNRRPIGGCLAACCWFSVMGQPSAKRSQPIPCGVCSPKIPPS